MKKSVIITITIIVAIITISVLILILNNPFGSKTNEILLKDLKGEIVYAQRDDGILNIYKISANGSNKKLLYHNSDINKYNNQNSMFPMWSEDGSKIYFTAMKDGAWKKFVMDSDGSNVKIEENTEGWILTRRSRESDIVVERGSVYYIDENDKKIQVYSHKFYDPKFNIGAQEASWSPDKKFIIFDLAGNGIFIAKVKNGEKIELVKITDGTQPDWKY